jgi:hypothetical protein
MKVRVMKSESIESESESESNRIELNLLFYREKGKAKKVNK